MRVVMLPVNSFFGVIVWTVCTQPHVEAEGYVITVLDHIGHTASDLTLTHIGPSANHNPNLLQSDVIWCITCLFSVRHVYIWAGVKCVRASVRPCVQYISEMRLKSASKKCDEIRLQRVKCVRASTINEMRLCVHCDKWNASKLTLEIDSVIQH